MDSSINLLVLLVIAVVVLALIVMVLNNHVESAREFILPELSLGLTGAIFYRNN